MSQEQDIDALPSSFSELSLSQKSHSSSYCPTSTPESDFSEVSKHISAGVSNLYASLFKYPVLTSRSFETLLFCSNLKPVPLWLLAIFLDFEQSSKCPEVSSTAHFTEYLPLNLVTCVTL